MRTSNKLCILKNSIIIIVFTVLEMLKNFNNIIPIIKVFALIYITFNLIVDKKTKITKFDFVLIIMGIYQFLISFINQTLNFSVLFSILSFVLVVMYSERQIQKDNTFLKSLYITFIILLILSFATIIMNWGNINSNTMFFIGGKNMLPIYYLPLLYFSILYSKVYFNKITLFNMLVIGLCVFVIIMGRSGTGIVTSILALFLIIISNKKNINKKIYYLIYIILLFLILNPDIFFKIPIIKNIIVNNLQKGITFTGRTYIWNYIIPFIKNNFWGYGIGNNIVNNYFYNLESAHNSFLELLLVGGIPLLIIYIYLLCTSLTVKLNKENMKILSIGYSIVFVFMINALMESIHYKFQFWWLLILIKNINSIYERRNFNHD